MLHNPESISILLTIAQTSFKFTCDNLVIYVFVIRFVLTRHSLLGARPIRSQPLRVSSLTSGEFRLPWQHGNSPGACPGRSIAQQREILYCPRSNLIGWSKPSDWQGYFLDFAHKASDPSSPSFANKKAMHSSDKVVLVLNL